MKNYIYLLFLFALISCASEDKYVYWCGDHPCANKKERKNYFKENMIVELRKVSKSKEKVNTSEIDKIIEKANKEDKRGLKKDKNKIKQARMTEKQKLKEEKRLEKLARINDKQKLKEQRRLEKLAKKEEKNRIKKEKKLAKKKIIKKEDKNNTLLDASDIQKIAENIAGKNKNRPYPQINSVPD